MMSLCIFGYSDISDIFRLFSIFSHFSLLLWPFVNGMGHPGSVQGDVPDDWGAVLQHHSVYSVVMLVVIQFVMFVMCLYIPYISIYENI